MRRDWLAVSALGLLMSCSDSDDATRTLVTVHADATYPSSGLALSYTVTSIAGGQRSTGAPVAATKTTLPFKLEVTPKGGDATRAFEVVFAVTDGMTAKTTFASATSTFEAHETRYVDVWLHDKCVGLPACPGGQTCQSDGVCRDDSVTPQSQPISTEPTGGTDAGGTPVVDAGGVTPNDSGAVVADAMVTPVTDAGGPPPVTGNDAGTVVPPPTQPCAGDRVGIWDGELVGDELELNADCTFTYNIHDACNSTGTYTPLTAATGGQMPAGFTLTVTAATDGAYNYQGNLLYCLQVGTYPCMYLFVDDDTLQYECSNQPVLTYTR